MVNKKKRTYKGISLVVFCLFLFISIFTSLNSIYLTFASDTVYSDVLSDLQTDENFNAEAYPVVENDYSLQVIQIAESEDKELFVYVYQPSGSELDLRATTIRFSTAINENFSPKDYSLTYLNSEGTLYKYKVNDFQVKDDALRYYQIICIFRDWNADFDEPLDVGGTIDEVSFEVAQMWTVSTVEGVVSYAYDKSDVVNITGKYAGMLRYANGVAFNNSWTDAHFVAFSTDYKIDELYEAKVGYVETYYKRVGHGLFQESTTEILDGPIEKTVTINCDEVGSILPNYEWFPATHTWSRIETVEEFVEEEDLVSDAIDELSGMEYVLRFTETLREGGYDNETDGATWYGISAITILQLKFQTAGVAYNLGVVDNKQTGDGQPDNNSSHPWWSWSLVGLACLVGLIVVVAFFPSILVGLLKFVWFIVSGIFKILWWLITAPFSIFKK